MKISVAIAMLQQILKEHGDLLLYALPEEGEPIDVSALAIIETPVGQVVCGIGEERARKTIKGMAARIAEQAIQKAKGAK